VKRTVSDSTDFLVREERILVVVSISTGLLDESGREAVCVSLVVKQLRVHVVIDLHEISFNLEVAATLLRNTYVPLPVWLVRVTMIWNDTYSVFKSSRPPKYVVVNDAEEAACRFRSRLELLRCIHVLDMLLKCLLWITRINLPLDLWRHITHRALSP
jgi:hypothetical protein